MTDKKHLNEDIAKTVDEKEQPQSDVYYKTDCTIEGSNVAVPTKDAVEEAKEWVDGNAK